jgi:prepilin-type N-terminal cleavage/methylation domain-containing protein
MNKAFTLLELVVVILIIGVLATLAFTQYGRMVEKTRGAEARQILGDMRKLAYAYRLANGTLTGIAYSDVNIGPGSDQIPYPCRSSHYFSYYVSVYVSDPVFRGVAWRCTANGKAPQWGGDPNACIYLESNLTTGSEVFVGCTSDSPW